MSGPPVARPVPDLERLTGVRSGKPSFYSEYRHSAERLRRVIVAMDQISAALVRTVEGSEALVRAVVAAAADHLSARWVVFALVDGEMPDAQPRALVLGPGGIEVGDHAALPAEVREHVAELMAGRVGHQDVAERRGGAAAGAGGDGAEQPAAGHRRHAHVPVTFGGAVVGGFAAWTGRERDIDATDESVLRILAGQTAAALQNCALYQNLSERNLQLQLTRDELGAARQHQALDEERHRIARELHDSVTQHVLSAGMQIELCRSEITDPRVSDRLDTAKDLTRRAVEQLRSAIYALNDDRQHDRGLAGMLLRLREVHQITQHTDRELEVDVRIGGSPVELPTADEQSLFRIASEALFNTAVHARARHVLIRLTYRRDRLVLSISDDGVGRPDEVRRALRVALGRVSGEHRGLPNMQVRARELGGTLSLTRARLGGLQVRVAVPVARPA